ncbi:MAG: retropepsin-like aspartic protease [Candidatus Omnitrophica bacterium]|nr:retropepsin-like aspartic protease [Candidatus Omnitrophota bacterium]
MVSWKKRAVITLVFFVFGVNSNADIIHLRNGRTIEGLVEEEDDQCVEVNVGFGIVKLRWSEIDRVDKSLPEDALALREKWKRKKLRNEEERKSRDDRESVSVNVVRQKGHIVVTALLDKKVTAVLLMDTGATYVSLSEKIWKKLKKTESGYEGDSVELILADGKKVAGKLGRLSSLTVQGVEARDVDVVIIPEDNGQGNVVDGLLGMSFLNRFNFKVDQNKGILLLEKLK